MAAAAHHFDVVVVGRGMIGSAAASHLARMGRLVALVGPAEPKVRGHCVVRVSGQCKLI